VQSVVDLMRARVCACEGGRCRLYRRAVLKLYHSYSAWPASKAWSSYLNCFFFLTSRIAPLHTHRAASGFRLNQKSIWDASTCSGPIRIVLPLR